MQTLIEVLDSLKEQGISDADIEEHLKTPAA
jgi:hypothetical protein